MIIEINEKTVDQESLKIDVDSKKESKKTKFRTSI